MAFPEPSEAENPVGIEGMAFLEYTSAKPEALRELFKKLGFTRTAKHKTSKVEYFEQNECVFLLNEEPSSFAEKFHKAHGLSLIHI